MGFDIANNNTSIRYAVRLAELDLSHDARLPTVIAHEWNV